jgi:antitoxin Phd
VKRKSYSIAAARDNFPSLVHAAQAGAAIEVTRRGKPIAVLLALEEYERLIAPHRGSRGFRETYLDFLQRNPDLVDNAVEPDEWPSSIRDLAPGRDFSW